MVTLFGLLEMNKRSLFASQFALQTVNHNISNVGNPGYSRQEVMLKANLPTITPFGILGTGVTVQNIRRSTEEYYTRQMRYEYSSLGGWDVVSSALSDVEDVLHEPSETGLSDAINDFFKGWNDLAGDPDSSALRTAVVESASRLNDTFHAMDRSLEQLCSNIDDKIEDNVNLFNSLLTRITDLNSRIVADEVTETTACDLRDERDRLLLEISRIVKIEAKEDRFGAVDIYIGGINVLHRTEAKYLGVYLDTQGETNKLLVVMEGERDPVAIEDGELVGLLRTRDVYIKEVRDSLDHIASVIINKVNGFHRMGWTPQGSGFDFFSGEDAASIDIAYAIKQNSALVATSYDGTVGDNALANDISALSESIISNTEPFTINELYESLIGTLGVYSMNAKSMMRNEELIMENLEYRKESVTGVNLDEELIKLTKYQQSYEAAARMLKAIEEMVEIIVDLHEG
jgi:flagellar hook-associated protein 1 FlgK